MIEIAKLVGMFDAEKEMAAAWESMTPKERKAYVNAHPNSRYNSGKEKGTSVNLHAHFTKHGWTKTGKNSYTHENGRKIVIKNPTKAGKKFHIEVHHKNGDVTSHHRNSANNIGALVRHWGALVRPRSKADAKRHYKPRAYKVGTVRKPKVVEKPVAKKRGRPAKVVEAPAPKKRGRPAKVATPVVAPKKRGRLPKAGNPQPIKTFQDLVKRHPELKGTPAKRGRPKKVAEPVAAKPVKRVDKIKAMAPAIKKPVAKPVAKPAIKKPAIKVEAPKPVAKKPLVNHIKKVVEKHAKIAVEKHAKKIAPKSREADWDDEPAPKKPVAPKPAIKKPAAPKPMVKKPVPAAKPVAAKPIKKALKPASREADW